MDFVVALDCHITAEPEGPEEAFDPDAVIEDHLDAVMQELIELGAEDPSIELDLTTNSVTFSVLVSARQPIGAAAQASGLVRTAIHAAGGETPDWPNVDSDAWSVTLVSVRSEPVMSAFDAQKDCDDKELVPV